MLKRLFLGENDENISPVFPHDELMMAAGFPGHFIPQHAGPIATGVLRSVETHGVASQ